MDGQIRARIYVKYSLDHSKPTDTQVADIADHLRRTLPKDAEIQVEALTSQVRTNRNGQMVAV